MGYFQQGSTILLFATANYALADTSLEAQE